jgi:hypothetical protein
VRAIERTLLVLTLLLLAWWPLASYYTSIGVEFEQRSQNGGITGSYWRMRWPSDGSVVFARIDFGAAFLQPPRACGATTTAQQFGFWFLCADAREAAMLDLVKHADRVLLIGMPHWLLLLLTASTWHWLRRQRRIRAGRKPIVGAACAAGNADRAAERQSLAGEL